MDAAKAEAWSRFRDQVVNNPDWPRELWFAAVEDALAETLGNESRLVVEFRQDVDELLRLERAASGSLHDEKRIVELEERIRHLIALADSLIGKSAELVPAGAYEEMAVPAAPRRRIGAIAAGGALVVLTLAAALGGAGYYYEIRSAAQIEQMRASLGAALDQRVADMRADLDTRVREAGRLNEEVSGLQRELRADIAAFSQTMAEAVSSVKALNDNAMREFERRLAAKDDSVVQMLERLGERSAILDQALDEAASDLLAFKRRMPQLGQDMEALTAGVEQTEKALSQTAERIAALENEAPALIDWLAQQRQDLEQTVGQQRGAVDELGSGIAELESRVAGAQQQLEEFELAITETLEQAKADVVALEAARENLVATEARVNELVKQTDARIAASQETMQREMDQVLSELAEKADLALLRGEDVMQRAEAEAARRVDAAAEEAIQALAEIREQRLTELDVLAAATRTELEQTKTGLVINWQRMDEGVAERHAQLLADLDRYAGLLEGRVQDFLEALDVMVSTTGTETQP